jgi:hypothetical protein
VEKKLASDLSGGGIGVVRGVDFHDKNIIFFGI